MLDLLDYKHGIGKELACLRGMAALIGWGTQHINPENMEVTPEELNDVGMMIRYVESNLHTRLHEIQAEHKRPKVVHG